MISKFSTAVLCLLSATAYAQGACANEVPADFTVDVHVHAIPDIYRQALIDAGYPVVNGTPIVEGFPVPTWDVDSFIQERDQHGYNYSILSISAPGLGFLIGNETAAISLARTVNNLFSSYIKQYPTRIGAFCLLPMPNINASLAEIEYCLDTLKLDGISLYTNYNGTYLGDPGLDIVLDELNRRKVGVLVHPVQPSPLPNLLGASTGDIEYPFDTTRAVLNLSNQGTRTLYPNVSLIFLHGGGTVPFLASRIADFGVGISGTGTPPPVALAQMQDYHYDVAVAGSQPQLAALDVFLNTTQILLGTDYPFAPEVSITANTASVFSYKGFSEDDLRLIKHGNAMNIFPGILEKLQEASYLSLGSK